MSTYNDSQKGQEKYSPKEHGGLTKEGQPDKRLSSEHGFGDPNRPEHAKPEVAGFKGGHATGGGSVEGDIDPDYTHDTETAKEVKIGND
ncbi:hypothetical protein ACM66B_004173 [Microbotryomycetes sp. NB124-2]